MDQIRGSLSESWAVTSRQSLTKPDVHTLPCPATETHCGSVIVCCPGEIQPSPSLPTQTQGLHTQSLFVCLCIFLSITTNAKSCHSHRHSKQVVLIDV